MINETCFLIFRKLDHVGKALLYLADTKKFQVRGAGKGLSSTKQGDVWGRLRESSFGRRPEGQSFKIIWNWGCLDGSVWLSGCLQLRSRS